MCDIILKHNRNNQNCRGTFPNKKCEHYCTDQAAEWVYVLKFCSHVEASSTARTIKRWNAVWGVNTFSQVGEIAIQKWMDVDKNKN